MLPVLNNNREVTIHTEGQISAWHWLLVELQLSPCMLPTHHCATCTLSAYVDVQTEFRDEECLLQALKAMGYRPEVYKEPVQLRGYHNDLRPQRAHIVVPRHQVGGASNDLGFERQGNGTYRMHRSEFDSHSNFSDAKFCQLKQGYSLVVVKKQAKAKGYTVASETQKNGKIKVVLRRFK